MSHEVHSSGQLGKLSIDQKTGRVVGGPAFQIPGRIDGAVRDRQYNRAYDAAGRLRGEQQRETLHVWRTPDPPGLRRADLHQPWFLAVPRRLVDCVWFCLGVPFTFGLGCLGGAIAWQIWKGSPFAGFLGFLATLALLHTLFVHVD